MRNRNMTKEICSFLVGSPPLVSVRVRACVLNQMTLSCGPATSIGHIREEPCPHSTE
jgi:hypothetical protein